MKKTDRELTEIALRMREDVLRVTTNAGRGHVTSCFSCVELIVALYYSGILKYNPQDPKWEERDYFLLSKGHADALLYAVLADTGFLKKEEFEKYCMKDSSVGPLLKGDVPGVEIVSGSLGCGLGIAAGIALSLKHDKKPNKVFCLLGDAECYEGSIWEAAFLVGGSVLENVITIVDCNKRGATHFIGKETENEPFEDKWKSFGFLTKKINGHDFGEVTAAYEWAAQSKRPAVILADTVKGKGVSFIENQPFMHGMAVTQGQYGEALRQIRKGLSEYVT